MDHQPVEEQHHNLLRSCNIERTTLENRDSPQNATSKGGVEVTEGEQDVSLLTRGYDCERPARASQEAYDHLVNKFNLLRKGYMQLSTRYATLKGQSRSTTAEAYNRAKKYKTKWRDAQKNLEDVSARLEEDTAHRLRAETECASWQTFVDKLSDLVGTQKTNVQQLQSRETSVPEKTRSGFQTDVTLINAEPMFSRLSTTSPFTRSQTTAPDCSAQDHVNLAPCIKALYTTHNTTREAVPVKKALEIPHSKDDVYLNSNKTRPTHQRHVGSTKVSGRGDQFSIDVRNGEVLSQTALEEGSGISRPQQLPHENEKQPSSQTAEYDTGSPVASHNTLLPHVTEECDVPELVSCRVLKRKREPEVYVGRRSIRVKQEDRDNSPIGLAGMAGIHTECLDLDEVPCDIETPRRRRLQRMLSNVSRLPNGIELDRAQSVPPDIGSMPHHLSDSFEAVIEGQSVYKQNSAHDVLDNETDPYEKRSSNSDHELLQSLHRDKQITVAEDYEEEGTELGAASPTSSPIEAVRGRTMQSMVRKNALQPLSTNVRILPRTSNSKATLKPLSGKNFFPLGAVSEDGDRYTVKQKKQISTSNALHATSVNESGLVSTRVNILLENPTPSRQPLASRPSADFASVDPVTTITPLGATSRSSPPIRSGQDPIQTSKCLGASIETAKPHVKRHDFVETLKRFDPQPHEEPLRARPLDRLRLDDFRINPVANDGYDYAFSEVVRNHDQRKCLPGCTRPACCGDHFRKMIEAGGALLAPSRGLWDPSQSDEADVDQRLLEAFLGDTARLQLQHLNEEQRKALLMQAKTKELAQKYGRHKAAFQRSTTPPGFWRTDMPTTQENEQDRQAARKLERSKVEERWVEALKPGGRWMFRDE